MLFNGTGSPVIHGEIVRVSSNKTFSRSLSPSALAGFIGVNGSGTVGPGGVANIFTTGASVDVLLESGLTPSAGDTVYVSASVAGRGTNISPNTSVIVGTIEDVNAYVRTGLVTVALTIGASASGSGGGGTVFADSVAVSGTTLTSIPSAGLGAGTWAYVATVDAYFRLKQGVLATDNITVVNAFGKAGWQWVRQDFRNPFWAGQTTWTIDPTNSTGVASDENIGLNSAAPLLTWAEHARRLAFAAIPQNVTTIVLGDQQSGDKPIYTYVMGPVILHSFVGSPTVLHTSTVTGFSAATFGAIAAADDCEIVDTAVSGGSWTAAGALAKGVRIRRTNGTTINAYFLKDLDTTTARLSQPFNPAAATTQPVFSIGDTYNIEQLPKIFSIRFTDIQAVIGTKLDSFDWRSSGTGVPPIFFLDCYFSTWTNNVLWLGGLMQNCCIDTGGLTFTGGPKFTFLCGAFKGAGTTLYSLDGEWSSEGNLTSFQGCEVVFGRGIWNIFQLNTYDCTGSVFLKGDTGGRLHFLNGGIGGKGNTSALVSMGQGSQCLSGTFAITSGNFFNTASTSSPTPIVASGAGGVVAIPLDANFNGVFTTTG